MTTPCLEHTNTSHDCPGLGCTRCSGAELRRAGIHWRCSGTNKVDCKLNIQNKLRKTSFIFQDFKRVLSYFLVTQSVCVECGYTTDVISIFYSQNSTHFEGNLLLIALLKRNTSKHNLANLIILNHMSAAMRLSKPVFKGLLVRQLDSH